MIEPFEIVADGLNENCCLVKTGELSLMSTIFTVTVRLLSPIWFSYVSGMIYVTIQYRTV